MGAADMEVSNIVIEKCADLRADAFEHFDGLATLYIGERFNSELFPDMKSLRTSVSFRINRPNAIDKAERIAAFINQVMAEPDVVAQVGVAAE